MIGIFDVLGFKNRFQNLGLGEIAKRYDALIFPTNERKKEADEFFGPVQFKESAYWASERDVSVIHKIEGAYASDTIILWCNAYFPKARGVSEGERLKMSTNQSTGWEYHPIPCESFMKVCNELMCHSLEVDMPLRGAIAMGQAIIDGDRRVFLGQPIIDASLLEHDQTFIGVGITKSFVNQVIPKRFLLQFDSHLKDKSNTLFGGQVLDWPRHWRKTRGYDLSKLVNGFNTSSKYASYYKNTLEQIDASLSVANLFETPKELSICKTYPQFASEHLKVLVRCVRKGK